MEEMAEIKGQRERKAAEQMKMWQKPSEKVSRAD